MELSCGRSSDGAGRFQSASGRVFQDDARALGVDEGSALAAFRSLRSGVD